MSQDNPQLRMILGGLSCVIAGSATHPMDTIKIRLQKEGEGNSQQKKYKNIGRAFIQVIREEGVLALYKGLSASIAREASYSTIRMGLYEPFKNLISDSKETSFFVKFVAGLSSGSTGAFIANPCDLLKVRMQASDQKLSLRKEFLFIYNQSGINGLYRGTIPNLTRGALVTATQLATYDHTKQMLMKKFNYTEGFKLYFTCAFVTGLALTITTSPVDLMKTRIMSQKNTIYRGIIHCAFDTLKNEGPFAFYKAFLPQWLRFGPFSIISFLSWEWLRGLFNLRQI